MRTTRIVIAAFAVILYFSALPLFAQQGGGHGGGGIGPSPSSSTGGTMSRGSGPIMGDGMPEMIPPNPPDMARGKKMDELLTQNAKLASTLGELLPSGTNLVAAAAGFKNLGQFVAAVHVAHNLDIPFGEEKCVMFQGGSTCSAVSPISASYGTHGSQKKAIEFAVKKLDPKAKPSPETRRALRQAHHDFSKMGMRSY